MPVTIKESNEDRCRKKDVFDELKKKGREVEYFFDEDMAKDIAFADLNNNVMGRDAVIPMLRHLDEEIAEKAEKIMGTKLSIDSKVRIVAELIAGKSVPELRYASMKVVDETDVPTDMAEAIKILGEATFVIFTRLPEEMAYPFVIEKVGPLYNHNRHSERNSIDLYATVLEQDEGRYTGEILRLPTETFRNDLKNRCAVRLNYFVQRDVTKRTIA